MLWSERDQSLGAKNDLAHLRQGTGLQLGETAGKKTTKKPTLMDCEASETSKRGSERCGGNIYRREKNCYFQKQEKPQKERGEKERTATDQRAVHSMEKPKKIRTRRENFREGEADAIREGTLEKARGGLTPPQEGLKRWGGWQPTEGGAFLGTTILREKKSGRPGLEGAEISRLPGR